LEEAELGVLDWIREVGIGFVLMVVLGLGNSPILPLELSKNGGRADLDLDKDGAEFPGMGIGCVDVGICLGKIGCDGILIGFTNW